eukprot:360870-Chlamydomonas_euryale.AAC.18
MRPAFGHANDALMRTVCGAVGRANDWVDSEMGQTRAGAWVGLVFGLDWCLGEVGVCVKSGVS